MPAENRPPQRSGHHLEFQLPAEDLVPEDVPPDTENACVPATFQWDFDDPCDADGWSTDGGWLPGPCQNHTPDGSCSLLLGDPDACLADAGGGKTISPLLDLTGVSSVQVEFSIFWGGAEPLWWLDTLDLTIDQVLAPDAEPLGTPVTIWAKPCSATMDAECLEEPVSAPCDLLGCEEGALDAWQTYQVTFDLSAYEWVPVPQRLAVLTFTAEGENPYLPMVDDILVTTLCE